MKKRPGEKFAAHVRSTRDSSATGWECYCSYFTRQIALTRTKPSPTIWMRPTSTDRHVYFTPIPHFCSLIRASCHHNAFMT